MEQDIWKFIDKLSKTLPEDGQPPPEVERIPDEAKGQLWEVVTKVWMWSDLDNHKYQMHSAQALIDLGEFTKEDAQKKINARSKRKNT